MQSPRPPAAPATDTSTGIAVFLMPADTAGITVGTKDAKMGQEGSRTADVSFADVRVGPEALVGGDGDIGYRAAMTSLATSPHWQSARHNVPSTSRSPTRRRPPRAALPLGTSNSSRR